MTRTEAIRLSLRAFGTGLFSLVPLLGLFLGTYALICWARVRRRFHPEWNPAVWYLRIGAIVGGIGLLLHVGVVMSIVAASFQ
jgi:hypothetical protein